MHLWTIFWCISNDNEGVCSKVLLFVWPTDCCIENEAFVRMGFHLDTHRDSRANFVLFFFFLISWEFLICLFGRWRYIFCSRGISSNLHSREIAILVLLVFPVIAKKKLTIGSDNHYNIVWWKTDWYRIIHCHWLNTMCIVYEAGSMFSKLWHRIFSTHSFMLPFQYANAFFIYFIINLVV